MSAVYIWGVYGSVPPYIDADVFQKLKPNTFYRSNLEFGYDFEQDYSLFASKKITDNANRTQINNKKGFNRSPLCLIHKFSVNQDGISTFIFFPLGETLTVFRIVTIKRPLQNLHL